MEDGLTWSAHSVPGITVGTHITPNGTLDHVNLMATNIVTINHFSVTNGLLYPAPMAAIRKSNEIAQDFKKVVDAVINKAPNKARSELKKLINKHTKK